MKIGIDARLYTQTGVGRYLRNLIGTLDEIDDDNQYIVYLREKEFGAVTFKKKNFTKKMLNIPWHTVKEQIAVPAALSGDGLDVAHFPYFNVPVFYPGRYLLTIHDLIVDHFDTGRASTLPKPLYMIKRLAYHAAMRQGIARASAISVISETTKREVVDHYGVSKDRMTVTYDALDDSFREKIQKYKPKKCYPFAYILYVGNAYPHKNIERLLEALVRIRKQSDIRLVLAGDDTYFYPRLQMRAKQLGLSEAVVFFGNANDTQLIDLYTYASCLVFPSLMEGFGLPTFEALAAGCLPVISDIPVFREIWDDDLPMFDPKDPESMANVILKTTQLPKKEYTRTVLTAAKRIGKYSWKQTALQTLQIYKDIVNS